MIYMYDARNKHCSHGIILSSGNRDGLLEQTKLATLIDEVIQWLDENIGIGNWEFYHNAVIYFASKEDAMAFFLRWS